MFEALAAYANMGDTPDDWQRFRLMCPDFFPPVTSGFRWPGFKDLSTWMYSFAQEWHGEWLKEIDHPVARKLLPPLLWYRNRLRSVWARSDQHGYNLAILLGFEQEAKRIAAEHPGEVAYDPLARPLLIPGQKPLKEESEGLPQGRPVINGVTGQIHWEFGCALQRAVYELMQERWRAKICPVCGRYFVAMKTAQKHCSVRCADEAKRERALSWWNKTGRERRAKARTE
jgi:hypothetical protein